MRNTRREGGLTLQSIVSKTINIITSYVWAKVNPFRRGRVGLGGLIWQVGLASDTWCEEAVEYGVNPPPWGKESLAWCESGQIKG